MPSRTSTTRTSEFGSFGNVVLPRTMIGHGMRSVMILKRVTGGVVADCNRSWFGMGWGDMMGRGWNDCLRTTIADGEADGGY